MNGTGIMTLVEVLRLNFLNVANFLLEFGVHYGDTYIEWDENWVVQWRCGRYNLAVLVHSSTSAEIFSHEFYTMSCCLMSDTKRREIMVVQ